MTHRQHLDFVRDFIKRWDVAVDSKDEVAIAALTKEYDAFLENEKLPKLSADELLSELHNADTDPVFVILEVDTAECSLTDFIKTNLIDEPQISLEQLRRVLNLEPGESCQSGAVEVKRIQ